MPKRGADKAPAKAASETERAINVLDLPERQLDLDTEESGSESDSEQGFSTDEANEGAAALEGLDADVNDDYDDGSADEVGKSVLELMQGQRAAGEDAPQDRRDRTAEAGPSDAQPDSDSSEDERPSRNTGQTLTTKGLPKHNSLHHCGEPPINFHG